MQVQSVGVDLDIYCREILSQVQLIERLYKPFELVSTVLNCFYLCKRNKLYSIDDKLLYSRRKRQHNIRWVMIHSFINVLQKFYVGLQVDRKMKNMHIIENMQRKKSPSIDWHLWAFYKQFFVFHCNISITKSLILEIFCMI